MKGKVLVSSSLRGVHSSGQVTGAFLPRESNDGPGMARIPAQSKGGPPGFVKRSLVAVDPIQFTPHKVVSVDFLTLHEVDDAEMPKPNPNHNLFQEPAKKGGGKAGKSKRR